MARKTLNIDANYYTYRKGATTHLINKDLPLSFISIKKTELIIETDKPVRSMNESGKGFPKMLVTATPTNDATIKASVMIYGDSILGLLSLEMEETDLEFAVIGAYDSKSNKWISNMDLLEEFLTVTPKVEITEL